MIVSISGTVQRIGVGYLVVLVGGVGLRVNVPDTVLTTAGGPGRSIMLHTHLHLRENDVALYGFANEEELELFKLLLEVSGVGPRLALAVVSTLSPDVLAGAVAREEAGVLQRVPGIGKKTAERVMFHLKDKLRLDHLPAGMALVSDVDTEVIAALTALGYSVVEAQAAVQRIPKTASPDLEERVRLALQALGG